MKKITLDQLNARVEEAEETNRWTELAESLKDTFDGIATGQTKATAAQAAILKDIWNRAYGRPTKSQEDKTGASGVVILPTIGYRESMFLCPICQSKYSEDVRERWMKFLAQEEGQAERVTMEAESGTADKVLE